MESEKDVKGAVAVKDDAGDGVNARGALAALEGCEYRGMVSHAFVEMMELAYRS